MSERRLPMPLQDPSFNQVRLRRQQQSHEYVVPSSQFVTLPNTSFTQRQMMNNAHRNSYKKKRFSLPPPTIREEDEMLFSDPITVRNCEDDDEEDIPLAVLAYRKGFKVPVKANDSIPLIQQQKHVYPNENIQAAAFEYPHPYYYMNPCFNNSSTNNTIPAHSQQPPSLYQLNSNSSGSSFSASSSNSSLSSIENNNSSKRTNHNSTNTKNRTLKYARRQSSHI